jgi:hypothetical protein
LLELAVRRRVRERANVVFRDECRVVAIGATPDGNAVASVAYKTATASSKYCPLTSSSTHPVAESLR